MSDPKSPGLVGFLIGNPVSVVVIVGASGWYLYRWWYDSAPFVFGIHYDWIALLSVVMIFQSINAGKRVAEYREWKRNWYAMQGRQPPSLFGFLNRIPGFRWLVLAGISGGAAYYAMLYPHDPQVQTLAKPVIAAFPVLVVIAILYRLERAFRQWWMRYQRAKPVRQCRSRPRRSPRVAQAYTALPDYCQRLLDPGVLPPPRRPRPSRRKAAPTPEVNAEQREPAEP